MTVATISWMVIFLMGLVFGLGFTISSLLVDSAADTLWIKWGERDGDDDDEDDDNQGGRHAW